MGGVWTMVEGAFDLGGSSVQVRARTHRSYFVVYTLDCTDAWIGARTYIQGCRVTASTV